MSRLYRKMTINGHFSIKSIHFCLGKYFWGPPLNFLILKLLTFNCFILNHLTSELSYIDPSYNETSYIDLSYIEPSYIEPSYIELSYIDLILNHLILNHLILTCLILNCLILNHLIKRF